MQKLVQCNHYRNCGNHSVACLTGLPPNLTRCDYLIFTFKSILYILRLIINKSLQTIIEL
jgi:hypothetical protein